MRLVDVLLSRDREGRGILISEAAASMIVLPVHPLLTAWLAWTKVEHTVLDFQNQCLLASRLL